MEKPEKWEHVKAPWADKETDRVPAQILLGADKATLLPICVTDETGSPVQTESCRLMESSITGRYIMFGSCTKDHHKAQQNIEDALVNKI